MAHGRSTLDYALLGLVAEAPRSGYELRKVFRTTPMGTYSDSPGSIYPALGRLERSGLLAGGITTGRRRRRDFTITPRGLEVLRAWLRQPVTIELVSSNTGEAELKLAFLSMVASWPDVRRFVRAYGTLVEQRGAELKAVRRAIAPKLSPSAALALDLGITLNKARSAWCRSITNQRKEP